MRLRDLSLCVAVMALGLVATAAHAAEVSVGDKAPLFKAVDQDGKDWSLQDHLGDKPLVVYFYPAAMTGGCTKQACSYRDYLKSTAEPPLAVVGISGDTPESLRYFREAEGLNFPLLSDADGEIARAFGVPVRAGEKSIKRTVKGQEVELSRRNTASRWTFIVNPDGRIIYKDSEVKALKDLANVLSFLKRTDK